MARPTVSEICQVLHSPPLENGHVAITGVATDSREVQPGQLFVALKGQKVDGHDFVKDALEKGAAVALVSEDMHLRAPLIRVQDPLCAMQNLARWHINRTRAERIAVTGSLGKTTTKEFLYSILKSKYKVACTSGNQNSQVGMAASLLTNVIGDEDYIVVEMGMTHSGHIKKLVDIVPPDMALLTEIALVHAENFESIHGIAKAKAEIFSHPKTRLAIMSRDSACADYLQLLCKCPSMTYSMREKEADFYLEIVQNALELTVQGNATKLPYVQLPAPHVYLNLLAACAMASCCNMSPEEIGKALSTITMPPKRLEHVQKGGISFINDSYNAAEQSLKAALSYIKSQPANKRKIAVIGQMRELGRFSESCHKAVGEHALDCVDELYLLGEECAPIERICKAANKPCKWFIDFNELAATLQAELEPDDLVLLKGSRSNGLWRVIDYF